MNLRTLLSCRGRSRRAPSLAQSVRPPLGLSVRVGCGGGVGTAVVVGMRGRRGRNVTVGGSSQPTGSGVEPAQHVVDRTGVIERAVGDCSCSFEWFHHGNSL